MKFHEALKSVLVGRTIRNTECVYFDGGEGGGDDLHKVRLSLDNGDEVEFRVTEECLEVRHAVYDGRDWKVRNLNMEHP